MVNKNGAWTNADIDYIKSRMEFDTPDEIANVLKRNLATVKRQILKLKEEKNKLPSLPDPLPVEEKSYRDSVAYRQLKDELFPSEIAYYEETFESIANQFGADGMLPTEIIQMRKAIVFEIYMNRVGQQMKTVLSRIKDLEKLKKRVTSKYEDITEMSDNDANKVLEYDTLISAEYASKQQLSKEKVELEGKHQILMKDLKATRDQRVTKLEAKTSSFLDIVKKMMDHDIREREGRQAAQMVAATQKEIERLAAPHLYVDGQTDIPVLNHETLEMNRKKAQ